MPPALFRRQLQRREKFLKQQLAREELKLRAIPRENSRRFSKAVWVIRFAMEQFRAELRWLRDLSREARHCIPVKVPRRSDRIPR
jgi:hypothetical protein